jgi:5-methylcytosine-specific restriction endonuclease McrA
MDEDFKTIRAELHDLIYVLSKVKPEEAPERRPMNRGKDCSYKIEAEIRKLLERVSWLHQQKNKIDKLTEHARDCFRDYYAEKYEARRKSADLVIAKESVRIEVFSRDSWKCVICHTKENLTIDHVIPVRAGGGNEITNLQSLCLSCNCKKGSKHKNNQPTPPEVGVF